MPMYRGGCGGSGCGCLITAAVLIFFAICFVLGSCSALQPLSDITIVTSSDTSRGSLWTDKGVNYDENTFQDYANEQYKAEFGSSQAYEDNLLLVFLADAEECYDYYYIAWVGDHIASDINFMFGNEDTELGNAIAESVNENSYKYSLDSNIAHVVEAMQNHIASKSLESSFTCQEAHAQVTSHLTNKTALEMTEETVNTALQNFTQATGIPIVVVVDDIADVFGN